MTSLRFSSFASAARSAADHSSSLMRTVRFGVFGLFGTAHPAWRNTAAEAATARGRG